MISHCPLWRDTQSPFVTGLHAPTSSPPHPFPINFDWLASRIQASRNNGAGIRIRDPENEKLSEDRRREPYTLREEVRLVNPGTDFKYLGDLITCLWFLPSVPAVRCPREGSRLAASCAGTPGARPVPGWVQYMPVPCAE